MRLITPKKKTLSKNRTITKNNEKNILTPAVIGILKL